MRESLQGIINGIDSTAQAGKRGTHILVQIVQHSHSVDLPRREGRAGVHRARRRRLQCTKTLHVHGIHHILMVFTLGIFDSCARNWCTVSSRKALQIELYDHYSCKRDTDSQPTLWQG